MGILPAQDKSFDTSVPVLIIGAGACGCTAALAARERGVETMILNVTRRHAATPPCRAVKFGLRGPNFSNSRHRRYARNSSKRPDRKGARQKRRGDVSPCCGAIKTIDWLIDSYGMPLSMVDDFLHRGHSRHHMHASPTRFGVELLTMFVDAVAGAGIDIATSARVTDLFAGSNNEVDGVRVARPGGRTEVIGCEVFILACNGFGGSKEMLQKYIPEMVDAYHHGHDGNQDDAIRWGLELGAATADIRLGVSQRSPPHATWLRMNLRHGRGERAWLRIVFSGD